MDPHTFNMVLDLHVVLYEYPLVGYMQMYTLLAPGQQLARQHRMQAAGSAAAGGWLAQPA